MQDHVLLRREVGEEGPRRSQRAYDLLAERFPAQSGDTATVVFSVDDGTLRDGERLAEVAAITERAGIETNRNGQIVDMAEEQLAPVGELIGIAVAIIVLTLVFRSAAAMLLTLRGLGDHGRRRRRGRRHRAARAHGRVRPEAAPAPSGARRAVAALRGLEPPARRPAVAGGGPRHARAAAARVALAGLRLGQPDDGNDARSTTTRKAYDTLAEGFGPGFNGPLVLAAKLSGGGDGAAVLERVVQAVAADPGVAAAARSSRAARCRSCRSSPLFMFALLFGLSMDYNVFLESRIREEYQRPAVMALLGDSAWGLTAWLDPILPRLSLEGDALVDEAKPAVSTS